MTQIKRFKLTISIIFLAIALAILIFYLMLPTFIGVNNIIYDNYVKNNPASLQCAEVTAGPIVQVDTQPIIQVQQDQSVPQQKTISSVPTFPSTPVTHIKTPESVKGVYMTSWAAGTKGFVSRIVGMIDSSELNTVVIDIKDATGKIGFKVYSPDLIKFGTSENRIPDIRGLIAYLHSKNIYVIGRISVFEDPYFIKKFPEVAVKSKANKDDFWKDRKGISWIDPGSNLAWDYTVSIAKESYEDGFDELNFDYIRFPSDGNMKDIYLPISDGKNKAEVLKSFFVYLSDKLKDTNAPISADLFGMTTTQTDDMNIGQILENALPYFNFIDPMVYPSHYPDGWNNFINPADNPYEVVSIALTKGVKRTEAMGLDKNKIRPWLQDFNLGAVYTKEMVRTQIKATYDTGLNSWLVWDAKNMYTPEAFLPATTNDQMNSEISKVETNR